MSWRSGFVRGRPALLAGLLLLASAPRLAAQGTLSGLQTDVDAIAARVRPCVVTVYAQRTVLHRNPLPGQPVSRQHVRVGSGVAVEESGILTTASVVLGAEHVYVRTVNGLQVEADVAGMDPIFNLALLRVPELRLPAVRVAGRPAQVGDWVIALGTSYRAQPTQSVGTIAYRFREPRTSLLQLTNTVYPGNSGGAALNIRGELVGIVQGELGSPDLGTGGRDSEHRPGGISFVIPVEDALPVYSGFVREGRVRHGYLGVSTRAEAVDSDTQEGLRVPLGAYVESVVPGGPAARAGLKRGDLIVAFDRERVEYPEQLARWVAETLPARAVDLVWVRAGLEQNGRAVLAESPSATPEWVQTAPPASRPAERASAGAARATDTARIADLEKQIQQLSRELDRLKGTAGSDSR